MSWVQKELNRTVKYAEGLGIKVRFLKDNPKIDCSAEWDLSGKEITVYYKDKETKTSLILSLVHELAHHLDFVYNNRRHNKSLIKALDADKPTRKQREIIYQDEVNGAAYQEIIYNELHLKLPKWKLLVERDWSLEVYKHKIDNPFGMPKLEKKELRKKLIAKYKI